MVKNYCFAFTLFESTPEREQGLQAIKHRYLVYGRETAPSTGTKHLQGAIYVPNPRSALGLWKEITKLGFKGDVKPAIDPESLYQYCKKGSQPHEEWTTLRTAGPNYGRDADVVEMGACPVPGVKKQKTDYDQVVSLARDGRISEIPSPLLLRHYNALQHIAKSEGPVTFPLHPEPRWPLIKDFKCMVFSGPSQCGKTQFALQHFPDGCLFVRHIDQLLGFNPNRHSGIVFDDFEFPSKYSVGELVHIVDWEMPTAFNCRHFCANIPAGTRKIFTINPPRSVFHSEPEEIKKRVTFLKIPEDVDVVPSPTPSEKRQAHYEQMCKELEDYVRPPTPPTPPLSPCYRRHKTYNTPPSEELFSDEYLD